MNDPLDNFYDVQNARELITFAAEAYAAGHGGLPRLVESAATDTHATLSETASDVIIAFRGTADIHNWLTDLDWKKVPLHWAAGRVHHGFNTALNSIAENLDRALDSRDDRRIWVTGHSLGGALAMLFALRLRVRRNMGVAGVYTYGQPRVGSVPFALAYDAVLKSRTHRVVHAEDIVPRVPWLLGTYRHAGHEIYYRSHQSYRTYETYKSSPTIDPGLWQKLPATLRALCQAPETLLADHHLKSYADLLTPSSTPEISSLT